MTPTGGAIALDKFVKVGIDLGPHGAAVTGNNVWQDLPPPRSQPTHYVSTERHNARISGVAKLARIVRMHNA